MNKNLIDLAISKLTGRDSSMFLHDLEANKLKLFQEISDKNILVIGGAGTIGSNFIKALLPFEPKKLVVVDTNENGLAELVRDIRSLEYHKLPEIITYPINFGSNIFEAMFKAQGHFDIVANFAAHKHVRSEKDSFSIQAMFENNFVLANRLLKLLQKNKPKHFFCVSTDKAANPVSVMGATKKLMEDVIFSYQTDFKITTARFANVAFSNGSLLESFVNRFNKNQPLVCPNDIKRFFVSPTESGQLCLLACILGNSGEIFYPNLTVENHLVPISKALNAFLDVLNLKPDYCTNEMELKAKIKARKNPNDPYPVWLVKSDTDGEKPYEEFYSDTDAIDKNRLLNLYIITTYVGKQKNINQLLIDAEKLYEKNPSKTDIITFLENFVDGFKHVSSSKNLDQKL